MYTIYNNLKDLEDLPRTPVQVGDIRQYVATLPLVIEVIEIKNHNIVCKNIFDPTNVFYMGVTAEYTKYYIENSWRNIKNVVDCNKFWTKFNEC